MENLTSIQTMSFILGGLLIAVGLLGGGLEIREIKIPPLGQISRILACVVGAVFIGLAVFLKLQDKPPSSSANLDSPVGHSNPATPTNPPAELSGQSDWLPQSRYREEFSKHLQARAYPAQLEVKCENGDEQFKVSWKDIPASVDIISRPNIPKANYDTINQENIANGYSLVAVHSFVNCQGQTRFQATWTKKN